MLGGSSRQNKEASELPMGQNSLGSAHWSSVDPLGGCILCALLMRGEGAQELFEA